jgi:hypothetical protein
MRLFVLEAIGVACVLGLAGACFDLGDDFGDDDDTGEDACLFGCAGTVSGAGYAGEEPWSGADVVVASMADASVIGTATADASGAFSVSFYPSPPAGTLVTVMAFHPTDAAAHLPLVSIARVEDDGTLRTLAAGGALELSGDTTALALLFLGAGVADLDAFVAGALPAIAALDRSSEDAYVASLSDLVAERVSLEPAYEAMDHSVSHSVTQCLDGVAYAVSQKLLATNTSSNPLSTVVKNVFVFPEMILSRMAADSALNELSWSGALGAITEKPVPACMLTRAANRIEFLKVGNCKQHAYAVAARVANQCVSVGVKQVSIVQADDGTGANGHAYVLVSTADKAEGADAVDLSRVVAFPVNAQNQYDPNGTPKVGLFVFGSTVLEMTPLTPGQLATIQFADAWGRKTDATKPFAGPYTATYPVLFGLQVQGTNKPITLAAPRGSSGCMKPSRPEAAAFLPAACSECEDFCADPGSGACGDGTCGAGEDSFSCSTDCFCGDAICQADESASGCPSDCGSCGDGACSAEIGETPATCEADCGHCGNGVCEEDKDECFLEEVAGTVRCVQDCCYPIQCPGVDETLFCP